MNNYSDSCTLPYIDFKITTLISLPISAVSLLPSLATVIFVCVLKLHKTLVYRLALYQVLSAMEFSVVWITAAAPQLRQAYKIESFTYNVSYLNGSYHLVNVSHFSLDVKPAPAVVVFEALLLGSAFIKLIFTFWIVIHLFALAVFHKNLQRLEPLYVVSSLLVPLVVTATLLGVNLTPSSLQEACGLIENTVYIIIFAVLVLISVLIVGMGTILCHRACRRRSLALSEYDKTT